MLDNNLYKGKYIIAVIDSEENIVDVCDKPGDIKGYTKKAIQSICARKLKNNNYTKRIELINVTEIHNDIFREEDELFLDFIKNEIEPRTIKQKCEQMGISQRSYYSRLRLIKEFRRENEQEYFRDKRNI